MVYPNQRNMSLQVADPATKKFAQNMNATNGVLTGRALEAGEDSVTVVVGVEVVRDAVHVGVLVGRALVGGRDSVAVVVGVEVVRDAVTVGVEIRRALARRRDGVAVVVGVEVVGGAVAVGVLIDRVLVHRQDSVAVVVGVVEVGHAVAIGVRAGLTARALDDVEDAVAVGVDGREVRVEVVEDAVLIEIAGGRVALRHVAAAVPVGVVVVPVDHAVIVHVGGLGGRAHVVDRVLTLTGWWACRRRRRRRPGSSERRPSRSPGSGGPHADHAAAVEQAAAVDVEGVVDAVAVGVHAGGGDVRDSVMVRVVRLEAIEEPVAVRVEVEEVRPVRAVGVRDRERGAGQGVVLSVAVRVREAVHEAVAVRVVAAALDDVEDAVAVGVTVEVVRDAVLVEVHIGAEHVAEAVHVVVRAGDEVGVLEVQDAVVVGVAREAGVDLLGVRDAVVVVIEVVVVGDAVAVAVAVLALHRRAADLDAGAGVVVEALDADLRGGVAGRGVGRSGAVRVAAAARHRRCWPARRSRRPSGSGCRRRTRGRRSSPRRPARRRGWRPHSRSPPWRPARCPRRPRRAYMVGTVVSQTGWPCCSRRPSPPAVSSSQTEQKPARPGVMQIGAVSMQPSSVPAPVWVSRQTPQTEGVPVQTKPGSMVQVLPQPSPALLFPSSQVSAG